MDNGGTTLPKVWLAADGGKALKIAPATPAVIAGRTPLAFAAREVLQHYYSATTRYKQSRTAFAQLVEMFPDLTLEGLRTSHLRQWALYMRNQGLTPGTINSKLSVCGRLFCFFEIEGCRVPYVPRARYLKWWLSPDMQRQVLSWCDKDSCDQLADFINWAVLTGLRVEESLRVERQHLINLTTGPAALTVAGTKTRSAQATIPLFKAAADLALRRLGPDGAPTDRLFDVPYGDLQRSWKRCATDLGFGSNKTATLKSLRRSFAKLATDNGMPTAVLQQYLRHASIQSTTEYLRLVGGINADMMRRWVT